MYPMLRHEQNCYPDLVNSFLMGEWPMVRAQRMSTPAINVAEDEKGYQVEIAAAGMTKEDVRLHINEDNELVITMEKKNETPEQNKEEKDTRKYLRREFNYSRFEQTFTLPEDVDKEAVSAKMEHGVLEISLPKLAPQVEEQKKKEIEIL